MHSIAAGKFPIFALLLFLVCWSCAPRPAPASRKETRAAPLAGPLVRLSRPQYPAFADQLDYENLQPAIANSLVYLRRQPPARLVSFGPDSYTVAHLIQSLEVFAAIVCDNPPPDQLRRTIAEKFTVYQAAGKDAGGSVLFTGYYQPLLQGRKTYSLRFPVPVHPRPADLVEVDLSPFAPDLKGRRIIGRCRQGSVGPYPETAQIRREADFNTIAPPLVWLRSEIDLMNLMVQGSGKVLLEEGETLQIGYDISNGQPYRSIGRFLIEQGKISADQMSMPAIRDYLLGHPEQAVQIMNYNPRYIFFRLLPQGPLGALGVPLTPRRSLAIDRDLFPSAAPAFFSVAAPEVDAQGGIRQWTSFSGFALAQDAGSAIIGPGRVDWFWGSGLQAEVAAGHLKHTGRLYFLVLERQSKE